MAQVSLYELAGLPDDSMIRDLDCTVDTPVRYGRKAEAVYGKGIPLTPNILGRTDSKHMREIYLKELYPLEDYDWIIVLLSGGKDSIACVLHLLELGVPKEKIELWHHDIDGGNPERRMDWRCTASYVRAFSEAIGIPVRVSYREDGFFGELYRVGASKPVHWIDPDTGEIKDCALSPTQMKCKEIREKGGSKEELSEYGYRMKFPAKTASLRTRWCSAYLKTMVASSLMVNLDALELLEEVGGARLKFPAKSGTHQGRWCSGALKAAVEHSVTVNLDETASDKKILVVSGERRGESVGRASYNEMEIHRTDAAKKRHRIVHAWRAVIDWSERDVWEILKRWKINPHPCYRAGWNRCSCCCCIFSLPGHFAGIKELYPEEWEKIKEDEVILGFTLDNHKNLEQYIEGAKSCLYRGDQSALKSLISGSFEEGIFVKEWRFPAGAFHGTAGGPC